MNDDILTPEEAYDFLRIEGGKNKRATMNRLAALEKVPARKPCRNWIFSKTALIEWLNKSAELSVDPRHMKARRS